MEADPSVPEDGLLRLRLLSWNLHAVPGAPEIPQRLAASAEAMLRQSPDVALLQEIWLDRHAVQLEHALAPGYESVRLPGEGWGIRRSGLIAFVRRDSDWKVSESGFQQYVDSAPSWRVWEADGLGRKGIQHVRLSDENATLHLLNTHLQAEYSDEYPYQDIRRRQLRQFSRWAQELSRASHGLAPVLAAGDFNTDRLASTDRHPELAHRERALYRWLLADWKDLSAESCSRAPCSTRFVSPDSREGWIDYVLWRRSQHWTLAELTAQQLHNERRDFPYSDHEGLLVDLVMRREPRLAATALPLALLALQDDERVSRRGLLSRTAALGLIAGGKVLGSF